VIPGIKKIKIDSQLNAKYTLKILCRENAIRFPGSAGLAIAKKPGGTAFNPLVVYGDVALGKTHLSQAIGNEILNDHLKSRFYMSQQKNLQIRSFRQ
jgi:chromosomal replication initiator protein